jgi:outer membrane lipoprotein-sorting protein
MGEIDKGGNMINKFVKHNIIIPVFILALYHVCAFAQDMTADSILHLMTETLNPEQSHGIMTMTIVTSTGQERTFEYETFSKGNGDKSLMKYLSPSRVKGQTILMLNDANDIWTYFPKTKRIRKLASHARKQRLEGSDFSYEDLGASDEFIEEYDAVLLNDEKKEGKRCFKMELVRRPESSAGYSRILMWVDKETSIPLVIHYFHDEDPELWEKELICSDIELIDGIYTPKKCVMYNKLDATHTSMEIVEIDYKVNLPDELFTEMGMQK